MWNKTTQGENLIIIKRRAMFDFQMILLKNKQKNKINCSLNPRKRKMQKKRQTYFFLRTVQGVHLYSHPPILVGWVSWVLVKRALKNFYQQGAHWWVCQGGPAWLWWRWWWWWWWWAYQGGPTPGKDVTQPFFVSQFSTQCCAHSIMRRTTQIVPKKNCATINSEVQRPIKPSGQGGGD